MASPPIYVEILIRTPLENVWEASQDPGQHQRWDLRFTDIDYLPRGDDSEPQRFRYSTRIGFGVKIDGEGESRGESAGADGSRVSSLRFWSDSKRSLIRSGSGYWRYVPTADGTRFLTWYDYEVRFGVIGRWVDRAAFRPLLGWATAWSFDRLRMWLDEGIPPEESRRSATGHHVGRLGLALAWLYQGVVPKLLVADSGELKILEKSGIAPGRERAVLTAAGLAEVGLGVGMALRPRSRWPHWVSLAALPVLAAGAIRSQPRLFTRPFNPVSLPVAMAALSIVALASRGSSPTAARCERAAPESR
jgi:hypothetical protein